MDLENINVLAKDKEIGQNGIDNQGQREKDKAKIRQYRIELQYFKE